MQHHGHILLRRKKTANPPLKQPSSTPSSSAPSSDTIHITPPSPLPPHSQHPMDDEEFGVRSMDDLNEYSSDWPHSNFESPPSAQNAPSDLEDRASKHEVEEDEDVDPDTTIVTNPDDKILPHDGLPLPQLDVRTSPLQPPTAIPNHRLFSKELAHDPDLPDHLAIAAAFTGHLHQPLPNRSFPKTMPQYLRSIPPTPTFTPSLSKHPSSISTIDYDLLPGSPRSYASDDVPSRSGLSGAQSPRQMLAIYEPEVDLVMPTVTVSRMRAPTPRGQDIGYFKVLVTGDSGIGKTKLITTLTESREVIAYDHPSQPFNNAFSDETLSSSGDDVGPMPGEGLRERRASTMVVPAWARPRFQEGDVGIDEVVPVNNLCFVDTVGYGVNLDVNATISPVTEYVESQFRKTNAIFHPTAPNNHELMRFLINAHGAHSHADACLYLILHRAKPVDFEYMRSLHDKCNLVPIIAKSDTLTPAEVTELKLRFLKDLRDNEICFFDFGYSFEQLWEMVRRGDPGGPPFAISTLVSRPAGEDGDEPENTQHPLEHDLPEQPPNTPTITNTSIAPFPTLVASDLPILHDLLFYTHADALRHATAEKFVKWRNSQPLIHLHHLAASSSSPTTTVFDLPGSSGSSFLSASYAGDPSDQDLVRAFKTQEIRKMSLHVARYMSDKRREMEQVMIEREAKLRSEVARTERRKRAEFLWTELGKVIEEEYGEGEQAREQLIQQGVAVVQKGSRRKRAGSKSEKHYHHRKDHPPMHGAAFVGEPDPLELGRVVGKVGRGVVKIAVVCAIAWWFVWRFA
ncbi:Septin-domain-containing protein [Jimgerdemannia flammicorona]|uniref:Septin-domain-containing protein n=1 Tax=Jimgerdemannia flammicorona TaxID=994334 RepID=A0A433BNJ5_9FUNG|nr:Septin-domain-containing protein [Jimgerdemannia flammicorona]